MVHDKATMYQLLAVGAFGNTIPQFFSVDEWKKSPDSSKYDSWGVRTQTPGGPCRLRCPTEEVAVTAASFAPHGLNISCMVDDVAQVTLWADVWDSPTGWVVYGVEHPDTAGGWTWRNSMPTKGRHWEGLAAKMLLRRHLNANSYEDVGEVFDRYPGHILELSALDKCFGVMPHRNAVVWEARLY